MANQRAPGWIARTLGPLPDCIGHYVTWHNQCQICSWQNECEVYRKNTAVRAEETGTEREAIVESDLRHMPPSMVARMIVEIARMRSEYSPKLDTRHQKGWDMFLEAAEDEDAGTPIFAGRDLAKIGDLFWKPKRHRKGAPSVYTCYVRTPTDPLPILNYSIGWNERLAAPTISMRLNVRTIDEKYPQVLPAAARWTGYRVTVWSDAPINPRQLGATAVNVRYECIPDLGRLFARLLRTGEFPGVTFDGLGYVVTDEAYTWRQWFTTESMRRAAKRRKIKRKAGVNPYER